MIDGGSVVLTLALLAIVVFGGGLAHSVASQALFGIIIGAVAARIGVGIFHLLPPIGKADIFALGLWATALLNISFVKSIALIGFVIPVGLTLVLLTLMMIRGFESSLILRSAPASKDK